MTAWIDTFQRGMWRGLAAIITLGITVWAIDRVFGGGPR